MTREDRIGWWFLAFVGAVIVFNVVRMFVKWNVPAPW